MHHNDIIFYNNHFISSSSPCISVDDRGFTFGDGLFETILSYNYKLPFFEEHWLRLNNSAKLLNFAIPSNYTKDYILAIIDELLKKNFVDQHHWQGIKIILTRGANPRGIRSLSPIAEHEYQVNILIQSFNCLAPTLKKQTLEISPYKVSNSAMSSQIKSLNYLDKILAKQLAVKNGYSDALLMSTENNILEATTSNIFFITKDGIVLTPPVSDGLLGGVTREFVITLLQQSNYKINIESLSLKDFNKFSAAFLTNAISGLIEIKMINEHIYNVHPITNFLFSNFLTKFTI